MAMNYKEVPREISKEDAERYATGIKIMADLADSLRRHGELPERFFKPQVAKGQSIKRDDQTPDVRPPSSPIRHDRVGDVLKVGRLSARR